MLSLNNSLYEMTQNQLVGSQTIYVIYLYCLLSCKDDIYFNQKFYCLIFTMTVIN